MGVWHGTTLLFVVYGLFLGLGATLNKVWQVQAAKMLGKSAYKELTKRHWYFQLSRALTLSYFAISLVCLWIDPIRLQAVGWLRTILVGLECFCLLTLFCMVTGTVCGLCVKLIPTAIRNWSENRSEFTRSAWMGVQLFLIVNALIAIGAKAPEFIYKAF
jgi:alginate O-acetyltransferase complex protein AlgI